MKLIFSTLFDPFSAIFLWFLWYLSSRLLFLLLHRLLCNCIMRSGIGKQFKFEVIRSEKNRTAIDNGSNEFIPHPLNCSIISSIIINRAWTEMTATKQRDIQLPTSDRCGFLLKKLEKRRIRNLYSNNFNAPRSINKL